MNFDLKINLDDLIDYVLTNKGLVYTLNEIKQLEDVMAKKVLMIPEPNKREFYEVVVEGLIVEMKEALLRNNNIVFSNPLKEEFDQLENDLSFDFIESSFISDEAKSLCKCVSSSSLLNIIPSFSTNDYEADSMLLNFNNYVEITKGRINRITISKIKGLSKKKNRRTNRLRSKVK